MGAAQTEEAQVSTGDMTSGKHSTTAHEAALEERLIDISLRLEALQDRVERLEGELAELRRSPVEKKAAAAEAPAPRSAAPAATTSGGSTSIQDVLRLVYTGDAEGAQKLLLGLPKEEMERNTGVVAIVAATLCVQRGDLSGGLRAMQRARQVTDDPRLLKVIDMIESQLGLQAS